MGKRTMLILNVANYVKYLYNFVYQDCVQTLSTYGGSV
jgi:hypothetical protein